MLSLTMVTPGPVPVPVTAQIELVDDAVEGAALVNACIACVCSVIVLLRSVPAVLVRHRATLERGLDGTVRRPETELLTTFWGAQP
jgi:hypothetical protein